MFNRQNQNSLFAKLLNSKILTLKKTKFIIKKIKSKLNLPGVELAVAKTWKKKYTQKE